MATKNLTYKGYLNVLNRVAYKLVQSKATYAHTKKYTTNKKTKTYSDIIEIVKKNGTKYGHDAHVAKFIEEIILNNKNTNFLPDFVVGSSGKTKYKRAYYVDMVKRVTSFRKKENRNPKTVKAAYDKIAAKNKSAGNCTDPYTSAPHYLESGCNKLGQCTAYYCGPHSVHQGLKKFGVTNIPEKDLAKWAGTTSSGTDHDGLNTAIAKAAKEAGIKIETKWKYMSDFGNNNEEQFRALGKLACKPNIFIFFHIGYQGSGERDTGKIFGHYEGLDKYSDKNNQVRAMNSLGNKCGSGYCGHLQWRSYYLQKHYINNKAGIPSVCIMKKV